MTQRRVVIGCGPDGLRAAAVRAVREGAVTFLQLSASASGLRHPDLPVETGGMSVPDTLRSLAEDVLGPLVEGPDPARAVVAESGIHPLPLSPLGVRGLLPNHALAPAARSWTRARFRNFLAEVVGGGQEERSHRDWVIRRMGAPAWHHLYSSYALRRWGAASDELGAGLARWAHGTDERSSARQVAGGGEDQALVHAGERILAAGGEVRLGCKVSHLEVGKVGRETRVVAVHMADGERIATEGDLWCAVAPAVVAGWLGDALAPALHTDCTNLDVLPVTRVALRGDTRSMPAELHVLDSRAGFWRVTSPYGVEQTAIFHYTGAPPDGPAAIAARVASEAAAVGLTGFSPDGARVERVAAWAPVWRSTSHARLRNVLHAWAGLGIAGVGRAGAFADLDPGEEIAFASDICEHGAGGLPEVHRTRGSPVVWAPDLGARITRIIAR